MPKYLFRASYTTDGLRGLMMDGGTKRREVVEQVAKSAGAVIECFYYAFGKDDAIVIAEAPDDASAAAISMAVGASGSVDVETTVLISPETIDEAAQKAVSYTPPGRLQYRDQKQA